jgi:hypothetical protein
MEITVSGTGGQLIERRNCPLGVLTTVPLATRVVNGADLTGR